MSADAATARANGAKSRGPKTAAGKTRSAQNATKHGLVARVGVLLADESTADYDALGESLRHELAPVGALEHEIVARIVDALWRLRRCSRLEAGALTLLRAKVIGKSTSSFRPTFEGELPAYAHGESGGALVKLAREADRDVASPGGRLAAGFVDGAEKSAWDSLTRHTAGLERSVVLWLRTLESVRARREARAPTVAERTDGRSVERAGETRSETPPTPLRQHASVAHQACILPE